MAEGTAIAGLGVTAMTTETTRTTAELTGEAIAAALGDAGLAKGDVDGLLLGSEQGGVAELATLPPGTIAPDAARPLVQLLLGFTDLTVFNVLNAGAAGAGSALQYAALAIDGGLAETIVIAHAFAGEGPGADVAPLPGFAGLAAAYGDDGHRTRWAAAARRHMHESGTTGEQLGTIAVGQREWAAMNPAALAREPLSVADHQRSPSVADPLRALDFAPRTCGAVAFVVVSAERAASLARPPAYLRATVQAAVGDGERADRHPLVDSAAREAGASALRRAGVERRDVDLVQLQDPCTYAVLVALEDYGFCAKGEGGPFAAAGSLGPGGALPTNTGGGGLSGWSAWDYGPIAEAVVQLRGEAGERQVPAPEVALVGGTDGALGLHTATVLAATPT